MLWMAGHRNFSRRGNPGDGRLAGRYRAGRGLARHTRMLSDHGTGWQPRAISGPRRRDCGGDRLVAPGNRRRFPRLLAPPQAAGLGSLAHGTTSHFADASSCW
jgi:hypothetical protein